MRHMFDLLGTESGVLSPPITGTSPNDPARNYVPRLTASGQK
jgi:hypothetical protein